MAIPRPIPCPLCQNPVRPAHLSPTGTCMMCFDSAKESVRERVKLATKLSEQREKLAVTMSKRVKTLKKLNAEKEKEKAEEKVIKEEKQRLSTIHREQASLALARRSLLHYIERKVPKYKTSWHIEDICRHIEHFIEEVAEQKSPRLILQLPPRSGKSEIASDCLPAWLLGNHPDFSIMITSYSDELPTKFSRSIREQIRSDEYRAIFPGGAKISETDASASSWSTVQGGGLRATGAMGSILGFGAHVYIGDDILKNQEVADSPGALDKLWDAVTSTMYSRLSPGGGIILIGQRWSHEDPIGRFIANMKKEQEQVKSMRAEADALERSLTFQDREAAEQLRQAANELDASMDKWKVVSYKALAEEDEYLTESGEIVESSSKFAPPTWRLLRKKGEALHPERYTRYQYLKIKRAASHRRWSAMYQQTPSSDEGAYFKAEDFKRYPAGKHPKLEHMHVMAAWDLAIGVKQSNDWSVGTAAGMDHKGNVWFLDEVRGKYPDVREVSDLIIDTHVKWGAQITGIERTHIEMVLGPILKDRMRERNQYISLAEGKEALKPITDKMARARTLQALCRGGKVYIPEGDAWDDFLVEMQSFGASTHDDRVDSAAWLAIMLTKQAPPRDPGASRNPMKQVTDWFSEMLADLYENDDGYMSS